MAVMEWIVFYALMGRSACLAPVQGKAGVKFELVIGFYEGRKHLPVIELKRVA